MFDKKMKNVADAVNQVLGLEEIDPKKRTKDTLKGADEPTKQKDDVGPGSDGKSTKVEYRPGPLATEGFKDKLFDRLQNHLDEASEELLARYMKSRGYNPTTTPKDKKIAITKSNEFKKWVADHQFEEAGYEDYSEEQLDEMINEVLGKDATAGDWIHDFVHSDDPKFAGKSKKKRQQMALAAYYAKQRNEEAELDLDEAEPFFQEELEQFMQSEEFSELDEGIKSMVHGYLSNRADRKADDAFDAGDEKEFSKQVDKSEYHRVKAGGKPTRINKNPDSKWLTTREETEIEEATHPKTDKEKKLASLAHPKDKITFKDVLVGRGVLKKEETELEEGKQPETDNVPFVEPYHKAEPDVKDKGTGGTHTPMSRAKHLARMALKKVKNEMLGKAGMTSEETEQIDEWNMGSVTIHSPGHRLHGKKGEIFHKHEDGRVNVQVRHSQKKGDVTNLTLKPHEFKLNEESEQIDEISGELASRYLQKKHDRDYESTGPHSSRRKEPQTMDQAFKDGKNTVRALKRIGDLRKFGKKAK